MRRTRSSVAGAFRLGATPSSRRMPGGPVGRPRCRWAAPGHSCGADGRWPRGAAGDRRDGRPRSARTDRTAEQAGRVGEGIAPRSHSGRHRPPVFTGSTDSDAMSRMCGATTLNILKYTPQAKFWAAVMLLRNNMHKSYASRDADPDRRSTVSLRPFWWALLICLISGHRWQSPWGPDRRFCARCLRRERVARRGEWVVDRRPKVRWGEIRRPQ